MYVAVSVVSQQWMWQSVGGTKASAVLSSGGEAQAADGAGDAEDQGGG